jgi:hypothetical protein
MAILLINPLNPATLPGLVSVDPSWVYIKTNDTEATVTTAGYLNQSSGSFSEYQMALVYTTDKKTSVYGISIDTAGVISLIQEGAPGTVVDLPVVTNDVVVFAATDGTLKDGALTVRNPLGSFQAGASGVPGHFISYPLSPASGTLQFKAVSNTNDDYDVVVSNSADLNQATVYTLGDAASATQTILTSSVANVGDIAALKTYDITFTHTDLASAQALGIVQGGGYKVRNMWLNSGGTNFSGGGGNRLIQVSDGTGVYTVIPAAIAQAAVNLVWGTATNMPFPASIAIDRQTTGTLFIAYSGGTTDYTAGSLTLTLLLEKVA